MILKHMFYDQELYKNPAPPITEWTEGVVSAVLAYDEGWMANVLSLRFKGEKDTINLVVKEGDGLYLCNDEGKTVEVISRLHTPVLDIPKEGYQFKQQE